jgi:hypothetical protein
MGGDDGNGDGESDDETEGRRESFLAANGTTGSW